MSEEKYTIEQITSPSKRPRRLSIPPTVVSSKSMPTTLPGKTTRLRPTPCVPPSCTTTRTHVPQLTSSAT